MNQNFVAVFSENFEITPPSGPIFFQKIVFLERYRRSAMKMKNESQMKLKCSMDGGCFILQPEADNSLTIMINIWYFSLEKHSEQVIPMI